MNDTEILAEFEAARAILKGHFVLSSGLHSDTYLQCARVLMDTQRADKLCAALADKVRAANLGNIDVVVAPAMGGVIVGYELARQLGVPSIFCERENGEFTLRRGFDLTNGARVLMVEDVVTTGKSSVEAMECVKAHGGTVVGEASLVNRSGKENPLPVPYVPLIAVDVQTYAPDALPDHLQGTQAIKPGSRFLKA
mgnify:CR=1 FL=1